MILHTLHGEHMETHYQEWHYQLAIVTSLHIAHNFIQPCKWCCQHTMLIWHTAVRNYKLLPYQRKVQCKHRPCIQKENNIHFVSNESTSLERVKEESLEALQIYPLTSLNIYPVYCLYGVN